MNGALNPSRYTFDELGGFLKAHARELLVLVEHVAPAVHPPPYDQQGRAA
jgi:hypothetical protein